MIAAPKTQTSPENPGFLQNLRDLPAQLSSGALANALVAWLFGVTGPLLIVLAAAKAGGLPQGQVVSWLFAIYFLGGALSVGLSLAFRQPIAGAHTIPAAVLVGAALGHMPFAQVVGAYWLTGLAVVLLGALGLVRRVMEWLPMPIMMGMVSAVLLPFGLGIIKGVQEAPFLSGITIAAFVLFSALPALRRIPPVLAAIVAGLATAGLTGQANWAGLSLAVARPAWVAPQFSVGAAAELVLPLVLMVVATQNAQGFMTLRSAGYEPPVTAVTVTTGLGTMLGAALGGHPVCVAGPMTAIIASPSSGRQEGRYAAGVLLGLLWMAFGLMAPGAAAMTRVIPASLVSLLGGLALLGPLTQFFGLAFGGKFRLGSLAAFMTTLSGVSLLNVAAPFWALVAGTLSSLALERKDFGG